MRILNESIVASGDMSQAITSTPIWVGHQVVVSIHAVYTGSTINGLLSVQASNDPANENNSAAIVNWADIPGANDMLSAAGQSIINLAEIGYRWIRLTWTPSGTNSGTLNARFNGKGI